MFSSLHYFRVKYGRPYIGFPHKREKILKEVRHSEQPHLLGARYCFLFEKHPLLAPANGSLGFFAPLCGHYDIIRIFQSVHWKFIDENYSIAISMHMGHELLDCSINSSVRSFRLNSIFKYVPCVFKRWMVNLNFLNKITFKAGIYNFQFNCH